MGVEGKQEVKSEKQEVSKLKERIDKLGLLAFDFWLRNFLLLTSSFLLGPESIPKIRRECQ
jgi:hypothetical protein